MKKNRIIPLLLLKNGHLVKSKRFCRYQNLGNPVIAVKRLSEWASDELIYMDITKSSDYDLRRGDLAYPNRNYIIDIIKDVSEMTLMPITVGGGIQSIKDIEIRLLNGADKVVVNSILFEDKNLLLQAAKIFGSQCMVVCIDYKIQDGKAYVYCHKSKVLTNILVTDWAKEVVAMGAGEILLQSVELDGSLQGYDLKTNREISEQNNIPVIACGGAGEWQHMGDVFDSTSVSAVAAANIFHYTDQSVYLAKKYLFEKNYPVRNPNVLKIKEEENALL
tara:strand:- start:39156 stop:39986 length:831 start_codon:yes stop_codon:yes gene_type:complete